MLLSLASVMISLMEQYMIFCLVPTIWHFPIVKGIRAILQVCTIFSGKESVRCLIILLRIYFYIATKGPTPLFQIGGKKKKTIGKHIRVLTFRHV